MAVSEELVVRVERLDPMRVASVRAVGRAPEQEAWRQLQAWAGGAGLLDDPGAHPVFGFNNPPPSADSEVYGYEFWIAVDEDTTVPASLNVKAFPGGLYAVTDFPVARAAELPQRWRALWEWVRTGPYRWRRKGQELERFWNPLAPEGDQRLGLYLPIDAATAP